MTRARVGVNVCLNTARDVLSTVADELLSAERVMNYVKSDLCFVCVRANYLFVVCVNVIGFHVSVEEGRDTARRLGCCRPGVFNDVSVSKLLMFNQSLGKA